MVYFLRPLLATSKAESYLDHCYQVISSIRTDFRLVIWVQLLETYS